MSTTTTMISELRDLIARSPYTQATVREAVALLPGDDAAMDALIGEFVARCDDVEFVVAVQAALLAGRPGQARHLAVGAMLVPDKWVLGAFACHAQGDVAGPLLAAITEARLPFELLPTALYLAARFHVDQHAGKMPGTLLAHARTTARTLAESKEKQVYEKGMLDAMAMLCADPGLTALLQESEGWLLPDRVQVVDLIPRQDLERRIKTLM